MSEKKKKISSMADLGKHFEIDTPDKKTHKGFIKTYLSDKAFGFIKPDRDGNDIFFHKSSIESGEPVEGAMVFFKIGKGRNGKFEAKEVKIEGNASTNKDVSKGDTFKLPYDTIEIFEENQSSNLSLALNKYVKWEKDLKINKDFLKTAAPIDSNFSNSIHLRYLNILNTIKKYYMFDSFKAQIDWRMTVGLGAENVHETSMTLHHIYGIPYIPGSALKGIARNAAVEELCDETSEETDVMDALLDMPDISEVKDEKEKIIAIKKAGRVQRPDKSHVNVKEETIGKIIGTWEKYDIARNVFGSQTYSGKVIFFDTYPEGEVKIVPDIMTPHYPDYYNKNEAPGDWQSPNPISFLTVEETSYYFCLAMKNKHDDHNDREKDSKYLNYATNWLKTALQNYGIGAKKSVGYGFFDIKHDQVKQ
jgi:CRISPR-associated protein Cmr6